MIKHDIHKLYSLKGTTILIANPTISAWALARLGLATLCFAIAGLLLIGYSLAMPAGTGMFYAPPAVAPSRANVAITASQPHETYVSTAPENTSADGDMLTVYWDGRYVSGPMSSAQRRKIRRTRAEIQEERRKLVEKTNREIDAIVQEFHEKLPREKAKGIGGTYARYSSRFQNSIADQVRTVFEAAYQLGIFIPREYVLSIWPSVAISGGVLA